MTISIDQIPALEQLAIDRASITALDMIADAVRTVCENNGHSFDEEDCGTDRFDIFDIDIFDTLVERESCKLQAEFDSALESRVFYESVS